MSERSRDEHPDARQAIRAVLAAVSRDEALWDEYVLKGGLALELAFASPRRSDDLDFNALHPTSNEITEATSSRLIEFADRLDTALAGVAAEFGFEALRTDRRTLSKEIPTLLSDIAYSRRHGPAGTVKLQLTLSEIVCRSTDSSIDGIRMRTATIDDIIAEKLKAILQQVSRDSVRSSDIFDVWYFTSANTRGVDPTAVTQFLLEKKKQWRGMPPLTRSQFRRKSVVESSASDYDELANRLPPSFELPSFRAAYECVLRFVDLLDLPS